MWRASEKRNVWRLETRVHWTLARTGGKPENKFKRRGAQLMSIQKKSLISTLKTTRKANVASGATKGMIVGPETQGSAKGFTKGAAKGFTKGFTKGAAKGFTKGAAKGFTKGAAKRFTKGAAKGF